MIKCTHLQQGINSCCRPYGVHWWWIPIVGPLVGSPIGAWTYYWLIEFQHTPVEIKGKTVTDGGTYEMVDSSNGKSPAES